VVYAQIGGVLAVPFDLARLEPSGSPISILDSVRMDTHWDTSNHGHFAFSHTGSLVYVPGGATAGESELVWIDREGRAELVLEERAFYQSPRLSPDGKRLATGTLGDPGDILVIDLERATSARLTVDGRSALPVWSPDGERITFSSTRPGTGTDLYWMPADGSGEAQPLFRGEHPRWSFSWSPDGETLAFYEIHPATGRDIWLWSPGEDPVPFLVTPYSERSPMLSRRGRWLAYVSDETGRDEVYVLSYPETGAKQQISRDGGREPVWSRDGRELFYRNEDKMMVVDVETGPVFRAGTARALFEGRYRVAAGGLNQNYDVAPDGQRFVMVRAAGESGPPQIRLVLNFFEELKAKVGN